MNNYRKICMLFLLIYFFICFGNVHASTDLNNAYYLNSEGYKLCQNDSDSEDQTDIYQEPSQEEDENSPVEIIQQPDDDDRDDSETN